MASRPEAEGQTRQLSGSVMMVCHRCSLWFDVIKEEPDNARRSKLNGYNKLQIADFNGRAST